MPEVGSPTEPQVVDPEAGSAESPKEPQVVDPEAGAVGSGNNGEAVTVAETLPVTTLPTETVTAVPLPTEAIRRLPSVTTAAPTSKLTPGIFYH